MNKPVALVEKDILLLASDANSLSYMMEAMLVSEPQLEPRILGVFDCVEALHALDDPLVKVYVVNYDDANSKCIAYNINNLILNNFDNSVFRILLVDGFNGGNSKKKVVFDSLRGVIDIRKRDFERNPDLVRRIFNTLLLAPDICISYGNDKSKELENLIFDIRRNTNKVLPYVEIYFDGLVEYKEYASDLLGKIKLSPYVVIIFNEKYFKSINCMLELHGIWESSFFSKEIFCRRIYPIVLESARDCIYGENSTSVEDLTKFWERGKSEYPGKEEVINSMIAALPEILKIISDIWVVKLDILKVKKLSPLLWGINCALAKNGFYNFYDKEEDMLEVLKRC